MEFAREERIAILTLGIVSGFVVALDEAISLKDSVISIDYTAGLGFVILAMIGMTISVFIHEAAHKLVARSIGYYTHIQSYAWGLIAGGALSLFTFGFIQFFTPNTCDLEADTRARIHKHRKYENWKQEAFIATAGIIATGILATTLHTVWVATGNELFRTIMLGNIWLMVYSLIPFELLTLASLRYFRTVEQLPQSDGLYIVHYSLIAWTFVAAFVLVLGLLLTFFDNPVFSIAVLVAFAAAFMTWFHFFKEG